MNKLFLSNMEIPNGIIGAFHRHWERDIEPHGHDYFEIEYVLSGSGTYQVNNEKYKIERGALFFMTPSDFHMIETKDMEIINVMFSFHLCDTALLFDLFTNNTAPYILFDGADRRLIEGLLKEIAATSQQENDWYNIQFVRCLLYKLAMLTPPKSTSASPVRDAIVFIHENFRTPITLVTVAKKVGLAPPYLSTMFFKETGINFKAYINQLRFDYATKQLQFTDRKIVNICHNSGFTDYTNFVRRFKDIYGMTPSEYRDDKQK